MSKNPKQVKQRREPSAVTIGNLELQNRNLEQRCADLMEARDRYLKLANGREQRIAELSRELAEEKSVHAVNMCHLEETQARLARVETHIEGYRMAVADFSQPERIPRIR